MKGVSKSITALIVTYNRVDLLKECIKAVSTQKYNVSHIIVIDNNSSDGTREYLDSLSIDGLIIRHLKDNIGGSGGFYEGMMIFGKELKDDYIWVMDDDTIPNTNSLMELEKVWNEVSDFGFLASNVRWRDGRPAVMNIPSIDPDNWNVTAESPSSNFYPRVVSASFVSLLIPRNVILDEGLPYKEFFIWEDDAEYTYRISRKYNCYFVPQSTVTHKTKQNIGVNIISEDASRLNRYFYLYRNKTFRMRKEHGEKKVKALGRIGIEYARVLFGRRINDKSKKLRIMSKGIVKGIIFNPKIKYIGDGKDNQ